MKKTLMIMAAMSFLIGGIGNSNSATGTIEIEKTEIVTSNDRMQAYNVYENDVYMDVYIQYIMSDEELCSAEDYKSYKMAFIDGDAIPEMILTGYSNATGYCVLTQHNGMVSRLNTAGPELYYIEKSGLVSNQYCYFGECGNDVYELKNGEFVIVAQWRSVDESMASNFFEEENGEEGEYVEEEEYAIRYYFNDKEMSEADAQNLLNKAFSSKGESVDVSDGEWLGIQELIKGIK